MKINDPTSEVTLTREWGEGPEGDADVLAFINDRPLLLSLLYDIDLLPEQHPDHESPAWEKIFAITNHWRQARFSALYGEGRNEVLEEAVKVDQTEFGAQGNCQSACLAMLLGIPLAEVPNFAQIAFTQDDNAADKAQQDWLRERGWGLVTIVKWQSLPWPPKHGFYIAGGTSKRGNRHGVVFKDGELWHDPHPDKTGIESVDDVDILFPLKPFRALKREPNAAPAVGQFAHYDAPDPDRPAPAAPDVEQMVKRLREASSAIPGLDVQLTPETAQMYELFEEAAALLTKLGQGWVPVSERLPDISHAVLVWCPQYFNIFCACRDWNNEWRIFGGGLDNKPTSEVTHWMPLPPAPGASDDK